MRTLVVGDIHGAYRALIQCLERAEFNNDKDRLILIGDIVDGWSEVYECVEHLLTIKNLICLMGNHDEWFINFLDTGMHPTRWTQGGLGTARSYLRHLEEDKSDLVYQTMTGYTTSLYTDDIPPEHQRFFKRMNYYFTEQTEDSFYCFVHGGFDRNDLIGAQHHSILLWDRDLWNQAKSCRDGQKLKNVDGFGTIFIGHTHVDDWRNPNAEPLQYGGVYNIDTGAGWSGKLTIMDTRTKEYWQSDPVMKLYPDESNNRR